jgi:hypothetical protein
LFIVCVCFFSCFCAFAHFMTMFPINFVLRRYRFFDCKISAIFPFAFVPCSSLAFMPLVWGVLRCQLPFARFWLALYEDTP